MTVELFFLGTPHFRVGGRPRQITSAKAVALLAYLAVTGRPQPRERVLALLWAESAEEAARKNLRNTLWTIRRVLGDDLFATSEDRLALAGSAWVDVQAFTAATGAGSGNLAAALDLYGGPFLDGLNVVEAPDFELWSTTERERLAQLYLRSLTAQVNEHRAAGNWDEVSAAAQAALAQDNLQEPMYRAMMEAYAYRGDRPAALRQYETLRSVLERELGVEPLPETSRLADAILDGSLPAPAFSAAGPAPAPVRKPEDGGPPLIGRAGELRVLDAELAAAAAAARVVLLTGELGLGKTRLWQAWSSHLGANWTALETRCIESTQALPFAPLVQLLRMPANLERILAPTTKVPQLWLSEISRLMPELRLAHPDLPAAAPLPAAEERRRLFEAVVQAVLALAGRDLVFFLDDAHWADQTSLDWLGYLVDRLRDRPLLVVVAYRPEEAPGALIRLAAGWVRQGVASRLPLTHLNQEDAAALIRTLGVDPLSAHLIQFRGGGNPYFLIELAHSGGSAAGNGGILPPVLSELIQARLERLSNPARQVLQAAAVLEPDCDFPTLRRASGRDEEETLDALDELLAAGWLQESAGAMVPGPEAVAGGVAGAEVVRPDALFSFARPVVAEVVRAGLSGVRRTYLYRRAAKALEATHAGHLPEIAGRLASAYLSAGEPEQAAGYYDLAAGRALALTALAEAVAFYRQAVELAPTPERRLALGRALSSQATPPAARAVLQEALNGFLARGDRLGAARASLELASTHLPSGRGDEVLRLAEQSLAYLDTHSHPEADPEAHAQSHFLLGAGRLRTGELAEAEAQLAEAARLADEKGLPNIAAQSSFELGNLLAQRGNLVAAIAAFHRAISQAQAANQPLQTILACNNAAYHEILTGDLAAARADLALGMALDEKLALVTARQYLYSTRGELALAEQEWDDAESWLNRALAEARRLGNWDLIAGCQANLAHVARGRADLDTALDLLEKARETAADAAGPFRQIQIDLWLADLLLQRGERIAALDSLAAAEARLAGTGYERLAKSAAALRQRLQPKRGPVG